MNHTRRTLEPSKQRNYAIDLIKLLLAIRIALHHYQVQTIMSSSIVVMSFFIISGYYLLESFDSGKYTAVGPWGYTKNRIKKIYLDYILAFCCLFVTHYWSEFPGCLLKLFDSLPELCMVQNIGVYDGGINYPLWQLCTLFIGAYLLFALLSWNRNLTVHFTAPVLAIASFVYMADIYGTHTVDEFGVIYSMVYVPMFRAVGGLSAGISLHMIIKDAVSAAERWNAVIVNLLGVLAFIAYIYTGQSLTALVALPFIMIYCFLPQCLLNKALAAVGNAIGTRFKFTISLEKWSLGVYFYHAITINAVYAAAGKLGMDVMSPVCVAVFIVCVLAGSYIMIRFADWLRGVYRKQKNKAAAQA